MDSWPEQTPDGVIEWRNRAGEKHRVDGPAVEHPDGSEEWYQHGVLHRAGGPAVYSADGFTAWYQQGQLHRDNGPARQWAFDGPDEFWRHGVQVDRPSAAGVSAAAGYDRSTEAAPQQLSSAAEAARDASSHGFSARTEDQVRSAPTHAPVAAQVQRTESLGRSFGRSRGR